MAQEGEETASYVPIATEDGGGKKKGHARRFSDSALVGGDYASISSWAPPLSPAGGQSLDANVMGSTPLNSPPRRRRRAAEPHPFASQSPQPNRTLQDQVLAGTLELLKIMGGATLSTTGKIVQPPLFLAQSILLPAMWSGLVDYLNQVTPMRVKDWFRILSSSVHHIITVIGNTAKGKIFRRKLRTVGDGIVDCVSSDASRQAITDGMAAWVKLSEAFHTPETKAFLEQLSVLGCRMVDAAASGRNKKLIHDVSDALWAGLELMADPSSTLAFAEVTAYLCFALEMEDTLHREQPISRQLAAQRRFQRNAYERSTYIDPRMMQDANTTVEEVMLSSLGEKIDADQASLPSNVYTRERGDWIPGEAEEQQDEMNFREQAADDIDLHLLQERITQRAAGLEEQREERRRRKPESIDAYLRTQEEEKQETPQAANGTEQSTKSRDSDIEEIIVTTVDENDDDIECVEETQATAKVQSAAIASPESKKTSHDGLKYQDKEVVAADLEKKDDDAVHEWLSEAFLSDQPPIDGESAPNRFYRRLDEIMEKKRAEAVINVLRQQLDGNAAGLSWFPKAAAAAGAGNERGQDTIKNRVAAIRNRARSEIGVGHELLELAKDKEARRPFSFFTIVTGLVGIFWFAMGFYGGYAIIFGPIGSSISTTRSNLAQQQEIVVRIVREVVHVDADGNRLGLTERYPPVIGAENADEVAACVAKAID